MAIDTTASLTEAYARRKATATPAPIDDIQSAKLQVVGRNHAQYEPARVDRVFNRRRPDKKPCEIVFPLNEQQVVEAVQRAADNGWRVSVRSGGHSWAAWSLQQDCMLIDMSKMDTFTLDAAAKTVTVATCMTGGRLNQRLIDSGSGLAFLGGHCPDVGLGGFLLQGGQGWGCRHLGWACEKIESFRVVMPPLGDRAKVITCSRTENADLFWAARGAGPGFFGAITSFTLQLRSVPSLWGSVYIFDAEECYDQLAVWYLEKCRDIGDGFENVMLGYRSDQLMPKLEPRRNLLLIRPLTFDLDEEQAQKRLEEFEEGMPFLGSKHNHLRVRCERSTFAMEYQRQWDDNPQGRYWVQNAWLDGPLDRVADSMKWAYMNIPSKATFVLHYSMDVKGAPPLSKDMCFDLQSDHTFSIYSNAPPDTTQEDAACSGFVQKAFEIIDQRQPEQGGSVGIYLGDSDLSVRRARFMGEENWMKWKQLRAQHDPSRMFVGYDGEDDDVSWNKNRWELLAAGSQASSV